MQDESICLFHLLVDHLELSIKLKELCTCVDLSIAFISITSNVLVTVPFASSGTLPLDVNPRDLIRRALPPAWLESL